MFNLELAESKQSSILITNLDSLTMGLIIDYAYTSNLIINDNNVQAFFILDFLFYYMRSSLL